MAEWLCLDHVLLQHVMSKLRCAIIILIILVVLSAACSVVGRLEVGVIVKLLRSHAFIIDNSKSFSIKIVVGLLIKAILDHLRKGGLV